MGWFITTNSQDLLHHKQNIFDTILNLKENLMMEPQEPKENQKENKHFLKRMFNKKSGFLGHAIGLSNASVLYLFTSSPWPRPFVRTLRMIQKKTSWCYGIISYWYVYININPIMRIICPKICTPFKLVKPKNCEIWVPCLQNHTFRYQAIFRHTNSVFLTLTRPKAPQRFRSSSLSEQSEAHSQAALGEVSWGKFHYQIW